jgi:hypothetical protein
MTLTSPSRSLDAARRIEHEWITVGRRRWCKCCEAYQMLDGAWHPAAPTPCPANTPYARERTKEAGE